MSRRGSFVLHGILALLLAWLSLAPSQAVADRCTKDVCIDREAFYDGLREFNRTHRLAQDPKKLDERSFEAMQDILDRWDTTDELTDTRWLAYIIATVFWETGGHLYPVREGLCDDAKCALAHLERLWKRRMVRQRYWDPDPNTGQSYYGRGQVQLTHLVNYWRVGSELERALATDQFEDFDDRLVSKPDLALTDYVSTATLIEGMVRGWFNAELGRGLGSYLNDDTRSDRVGYLEARRTVNGMDKRDLLADFALDIHRFVRAVPAASAPKASVDTATAPVEGEAETPKGADGKVRGRRVDDVERGNRVGPTSGDEPEPPSRERPPIDFEHPVGPIENLTGVVGGAAAAAATGNLRTPPTKQELRERKKKRRLREKRRRKRQRKKRRRQRRQRRDDR